MGFSVNVLFYGDHQPLAARCLNSILAAADWSLIDEFRFGLNAVSDATRNYLETTARERIPKMVHFYEPKDGKNVGKYPLMRRMFFDPQPYRRMTSQRIMWFDDDSFLTTQDAGWWQRVWQKAKDSTLLGVKYRISLRGRQHLGIKHQPWYTMRPSVGQGMTVHFCQGGWWVAPRAELEFYDYPFKELHHNGGDVMLGVLARQQGWEITSYTEGIATNADDTAVNSTAKRRGLDTQPLWVDFDPTVMPTFTHQQFEVTVGSFHYPAAGRTDASAS